MAADIAGSAGDEDRHAASRLLNHHAMRRFDEYAVMRELPATGRAPGIRRRDSTRRNIQEVGTVQAWAGLHYFQRCGRLVGYGRPVVAFRLDGVRP